MQAAQISHPVGTATTRQTSGAGLGKRILGWLDFAGATFALASAWSSHRPVDAKTLARAGMTAELQDRVMQLRY